MVFCLGALDTRHSNSVIYDGGFGPHHNSPNVQRNWILDVPTWPLGGARDQKSAMQVVGGSPSKIFGSGELPRLETPVNSERCLRGGQEALMPVPDSIGNDHRGSCLDLSWSALCLF